MENKLLRLINQILNKKSPKN